MARANQLRLTTKLARQVGRNSIYEPARIKPRGGKKRAVTLVAPFISHHLQLQYPDRYTDLFACYEMRAITFANMRRHIHIRTYIHVYIYRSRRINISRTIFLFSFYFFSLSAKSCKLLSCLGCSRIIVEKIISVVCGDRFA